MFAYTRSFSLVAMSLPYIISLLLLLPRAWCYGVELRSSSSYLQQGENVTFTCSLRNVQQSAVLTWYKLLSRSNNDDRVTVANRNQLTPPFMATGRYTSVITNEIRSATTNFTNVTAELRITRVQKEDEGTIGCRVANRAGSTTNIVVHGRIIKLQIDQHRAGTEINHLDGDTAVFDYPATDASAIACHVEATTDDIETMVRLNRIPLVTGFSNLVQWRTVSGRDTGLERRLAVTHYRSESFSPSIEDDGRPLECIARGRHSSQYFLSHVVLSVRYAPEGICLTPKLMSDDRVHLVCTVRSNPRYEEANWSWIADSGQQVRAVANETSAIHSVPSYENCSNRNVVTFEMIMTDEDFAARSHFFFLIRNVIGSTSLIVPLELPASHNSAAGSQAAAASGAAATPVPSARVPGLTVPIISPGKSSENRAGSPELPTQSATVTHQTISWPSSSLAGNRTSGAAWISTNNSADSCLLGILIWMAFLLVQS